MRKKFNEKQKLYKYIPSFIKKEILNLRDVYFKDFPLKSSKAYKLNLIEEFYQLNHYNTLDVKNMDKFNQWLHFKNKWDKIV